MLKSIANEGFMRRKDKAGVMQIDKTVWKDKPQFYFKFQLQTKAKAKATKGKGKGKKRLR